MKATKATVANAAAISSKITAIANNNSDFPDHANKENNKFHLLNLLYKFTTIRIQKKLISY